MHDDDRCGARKRDGTPCPVAAMVNGRCRMHGGASLPPGPNHPSWKTGLHSKAIPDRLRERIAAADSDPGVLSHRRDLALLDARLEELLERLTQGGSGQLWKELGTAWHELTQARASGDSDRLKASLASVGGIITAGIDDERVWQEARSVIRDRREQATHEHKRTLELSQAIRPDELGAIIARISFVIREHVTDDDQRRRIAAAIELLSNHPDMVN